MESLHRDNNRQHQTQVAEGKWSVHTWTKIILVINHRLFAKGFDQQVKRQDENRGPDQKIGNWGLILFPLSFHIPDHNRSRIRNHPHSRIDKPFLDVGKKVESIMPEIGKSNPFGFHRLPAITAVFVLDEVTAVLTLFHGA